MRRNFDKVILGLDNQPLYHEAKVLTLAGAAINALLANYDGENVSGTQKHERMKLALAINDKPTEVDLTAEQLAKLKELIGRAYTPLVVGRAYDLLEMEPRAVESA